MGNEFSIFACGDIVNSKGRKYIVDSKLEKLIKQTDIAICNFEAPLADDFSYGIDKVGEKLYQTRESLEAIKSAGINVLSLANNHIYDYGDHGLEQTIKLIDQNKLTYVGAGMSFIDAYEIKVLDANGFKIGLISACEAEFGCLMEEEDRGGYAWINHHIIEDNIRKLKKKVDFIIFNCHSGVEDVDIPLPEWREKYKRFCDLGVDVVLGHHPHVPQGYENHNKSLIFYSLGNFYFDWNEQNTKRSESFSVLLDITKDGIKEFRLIYHKIINDQTTVVDPTDVGFSIENLNMLLDKNTYFHEVDKVVSMLYNERYIPFYLYALSSFPLKGSLKEKLKFFIINLFLRKRFNSKKKLMLLHNIRIESHRFVVQRALSKLFEKKIKKDKKK